MESTVLAPCLYHRVLLHVFVTLFYIDVGDRDESQLMPQLLFSAGFMRDSTQIR